MAFGKGKCHLQYLVALSISSSKTCGELFRGRLYENFQLGLKLQLVKPSRNFISAK